jgi:hypothetical protein
MEDAKSPIAFLNGSEPPHRLSASIMHSLQTAHKGGREEEEEEDEDQEEEEEKEEEVGGAEEQVQTMGAGRVAGLNCSALAAEAITARDAAGPLQASYTCLAFPSSVVGLATVHTAKVLLAGKYKMLPSLAVCTATPLPPLTEAVASVSPSHSWTGFPMQWSEKRPRKCTPKDAKRRVLEGKGHPQPW